VTETHEFVERVGKPTAEVWEIPRRVWFILLSWGLAVLVLAGLLSAWIWTAQRNAERERDSLNLRQDLAMCAMIDLFTSGPAPTNANDPTGDRRAARKAMLDYRATLLNCSPKR
jgi:hypothetical protein